MLRAHKVAIADDGVWSELIASGSILANRLGVLLPSSCDDIGIGYRYQQPHVRSLPDAASGASALETNLYSYRAHLKVSGCHHSYIIPR